MLYMLKNWYIGKSYRPNCEGLVGGLCHPFLVAFAKLQKATICFVMFFRPSVRPSAWKNSAGTSMRLYLKAFAADVNIQ